MQIKNENILGYSNISFQGSESAWNAVKEEVETALLSAPTHIRNNYIPQLQKRLSPILSERNILDVSSYHVDGELGITTKNDMLETIRIYTRVRYSDNPSVVSFHINLNKKADSKKKGYELQRITTGAEEGLWESCDRDGNNSGYMHLEECIDFLRNDAKQAKKEDMWDKYSKWI